MRYTDRENILGVIAKHPQGITARDITSALWPERTGIEQTMSYDWVKKNIQVLKRHDLIEGGETNGKAYLWRVKI